MLAPHSESVTLSQLADIKPGYPFRGAIKPDPSGDTHVVQARHITPETGLNVASPYDPLDRVQLTGRRKPDFLQPGDILFLARGSRNLAACIQADIPKRTVCTPHFFLLRLKKPALALVDPDFLAWQIINHTEAQIHFARGSQGSALPNVSKSELMTLPIALPSMEKQRLMAKLYQASLSQASVLQQLIDNLHKQVQAVGQDMLHVSRPFSKGNKS